MGSGDKTRARVGSGHEVFFFFFDVVFFCVCVCVWGGGDL